MAKLLIDEMLKKTAKWLRIFGIDSEFAEGRNDDELLRVAQKDARVLVTKDVPLYSRCVKTGARCFFVRSMDLAEQIAEIKTGLGLEFTFPEKTRCPSCNTPLELVPKEKVEGLVEPGVLERFNKFWLCPKEKKAYWEGAHWKNITRIFDTVQELAKSGTVVSDAKSSEERKKRQ